MNTILYWFFKPKYTERILAIYYCEFCHAVWWKSPYRYSKLCNINSHETKWIHCVAIFTILYGNHYPPHGEFKLTCIGKFARRVWVNFTQQYSKNRQRYEKNNFTMLYGNYCYIIIENFPQKFSPYRHLQIEVGGWRGWFRHLQSSETKKQKRLLFGMLVAPSWTRIKHFY